MTTRMARASVVDGVGVFVVRSGPRVDGTGWGMQRMINSGAAHRPGEFGGVGTLA